MAPGSPPDQAVAALGAAVVAEKDSRLAFRGISVIRPSDGFVDVVLHEWEEPELLDIGAGNAVACHLVTPAKTFEAVTAGAD